MTSIAENLIAINGQISLFEQRYDRSTGSVNLLAVSKRQSIEKIRQAHIAGASHFGENYVQEAIDKMAQLTDLDLVWHFIGPIQSNKTRAIAEHFDWVHSVDRAKVASRLNDQRQADKQPLNVCVQVNLSEEATKSGVLLSQTLQLCQHVAEMPNLSLRGLMAIPAASNDLDSQRHSFRRLAEEQVSLSRQFPTMDTLSIGMSGDFEAAIAEGSTMVRVGTSIFGARES